MAKNSWMVKDLKGRSYGPFSHARLQQLIAKAVFTGEEKVAHYPNGEWIDITKIPDFYDQILEVLSSEVNPPSQEIRHRELSQMGERVLNPEEQSIHADTEARRVASEQDTRVNEVKQQEEKAQPSKRVDFGKSDPRIEKPKKTVPPPPKFDDAHDVVKLPIEKDEVPPLDLANEEKLVSKKRRQNLLTPVLLVAVVAAAGFYILESDKKRTNGERIHLLAPKKSKTELSEQQISQRLKHAVELFRKDQFTSYLGAQTELVEIVQSSALNREALALLCYTYRELWPFSYQDNSDQSTVAQVVQTLAQVDPVGEKGTACRIAQQMIRNDYQNADTQLRSLLQQYPSSVMLYEMKAVILADQSDYRGASLYVDQARKLWPDWMKLDLMAAQFSVRLNQEPDAKIKLEGILKKYPQNAQALIELGILEAQRFQNETRGVELIRTGLEADRVAKGLAARGYAVMALLSEKAHRTSDALSNAQKSYQLDPTNSGMADLIKRLGGKVETKVAQGACSEIIALGEKYIRERNFMVAQAEFRAAFDACEPKSGRAALRAGQSLWELNQSREALEWLNKSIAADPKGVEAYLTMADYQSQLYDFTAAFSALKQGERYSKDLHQILRSYALVSLRQNGLEDAVKFGERALKIYDTDMETHLILVRAHLGLKDYRKAYQIAARAIELDRFNPEAQGLYAEVLAGFQGAAAGVKYIETLINTYPRVTEYRASLGRIYRNDEKYSLAIEAFKQAVSLEPQNKEILEVLGDVYLKDKKNEDALKSYLTAATIDPTDAYPLFLIGKLYLQLGTPRDALKYFEKSYQINPKFPRAHFFAGRAAANLQDWDRALKEAQAEKKANPQLADAYILAGEVYMKRPEPSYTKAAEEIQGALKLRSQSADVYIMMARAQRMQKRFDIALSMLSIASSKESGNPEIYKELGAVYETKGDVDQAYTAYSRYLELAPTALDVSIIEKRRAQLGRVQ